MIEPAQLLILLKLLAAHLLADFLFQPRSWIRDKRKHGHTSVSLYKHAGVVLILTWLFLQDWKHVGLPLFIALTHLGIDRWKARQKDSLRYFLLDQFLHLAMMLLGWYWYSQIDWSAIVQTLSMLDRVDLYLVLTGYLIAIWPFGYIIALATDRWKEDLSQGKEPRLSGLPDAGMWIGRAERFLILTFILLNQYSAIGFLIAAKSVFRFSGKLETNRDRKEAEYILIGTLLSFALAVALGIGVRALLRA